MIARPDPEDSELPLHELAQGLLPQLPLLPSHRYLLVGGSVPKGTIQISYNTVLALREPCEQPGAIQHLRIYKMGAVPVFLEVVTAYLSGNRHHVETAANGKEGLEKFLAGSFDVVVTDHGMPGMSSDQLATAIKRVAPTRSVILLTGFGDIMKSSGEKPADVDIIVSKPVTLTTLREAIAKVTAEQIPSR